MSAVVKESKREAYDRFGTKLCQNFEENKKMFGKKLRGCGNDYRKSR